MTRTSILVGIGVDEIFNVFLLERVDFVAVEPLNRLAVRFAFFEGCLQLVRAKNRAKWHLAAILGHVLKFIDVGELTLV
jgi:hypothetical protein